MRSAALVTGFVLLAAAGSPAQTAQPAFTYERPVVVDGAGPRRLPVDVPLLSGAQPFAPAGVLFDPATGTGRTVFAAGAGDLRLFDPAGREVSYLLVAPAKTQAVWTPGRIAPIAPVETAKRRTSGFEADFEHPQRVDAVRLSGIPAPFLKRVRLEGSGDRAHWTLLADEGTLFDLPAEHLQQTALTFAPGVFQYLRITWDDTQSGRVPLPGGVGARLVPGRSRPDVALVQPLAFERRASEPGVSRFRVRLPAPRLPIVALVLDAGGGHLLRPITVYEARVTGTEALPHALGSGMLRRVVQDGVAAAALRVPVTPPQEAQLDIEVGDGDGGPLDLKGVSAEFGELPWIYFEADGQTITARYGSRSFVPPRYDLEAVRADLKIDDVADASWGEAVRREAAPGTTPAPPMPTVGAAIDTTGFRFARTMPSGDRALVRLALDAAVLAHAGGQPGRYADVRIVDTASRQVPYLVERGAEPLSIDLRFESTSAPKGIAEARTTRSYYRVHLPYDRLPAARLVVSTTARVFSRALSIAEEREADRAHRERWARDVATVAWNHRDESTPAPPLVIPIDIATSGELTLVVDEGDNAPLPIAGIRLLLPAYFLRFFREKDAALRLVYGRDDLESPRYDLALLAPQLVGAAAIDIVPSAESTTPAGGAPAVLVSPRLFWSVLAGAVIVLVAFIVRLMKKDVPPESPTA